MPVPSSSPYQELSVYLRRTSHISFTKLCIYVRRVSDALRTEDWSSVKDVQASVEVIWNIGISAQKPFAFPKIVRLLLEAVLLMEFFRYDSYKHYKTLNEIIDHNKKIRELEKSKGSANSARPVKLNFDGELEEVASVSSQRLINDTVNLDDEREIQLPLTKAFEALRTIFANNTWKTAIMDVDLDPSEFATEAVQVLVYMSSFFQLHRMSHDALLAAKLAYSLTLDISLPVETTLSVGISYMMCLLPSRLYDTAASVLDKTTEIASCEEDWKVNHPLQFAMLMAQGAWLMLLKQQVSDLAMAFGAVKFCSDLPKLQEGDKSLVKGVYLRLLANLCVVYRSLDPEDQNALASIVPRNVSPLWLLEEAKTQLTSNFYEGSTSGWAGLARLYRKIEHFDLIENISNLYLSTGAPSEAWAYIAYGLKLARREFSCRWILVFLDLQARSYFNNEGTNYYQKFQSTVFEMDRMLLIKNASISEKLRAKVPLEGVQSGGMNDLSAALGRIGISESDVNAKAGEESSSANGMEDEEWATAKHIAKLCILDPSLHPQKGEQECGLSGCVDLGLDLDLHGALMKTIVLRFTALKAGKLRDAMLKRACEIHDILNRKRIILKTFDENPQSLTSPIAAPFFRVRFNHAARSFLNFRRSTTFEDAVTRLVERFPDFTVLYPDIVAQSRYLQILCKIIEELPNAKALRVLLNGSCGSRSNEMNTTDSDFIDDKLTATLSKSSGKSAFPRPVTPERQPANAAVLHVEKQKREKNESRHRRRINQNEEPSIPGDLAREAEEQSRMIANRRKTMWQDTVNLSSNSTLLTLGAEGNAASSKSIQSDKVQGILDLIDAEIARLVDFPLFPYFRNLTLLRCLMTKHSCTSESYAILSGAGIGGKLNHQLLSFRNQADRVSFDNVMEYCAECDVTDKSDYITRLPAVNNSLLPENWVVCGISLVTKPILPVFGDTSADLLYVMITRWEREMSPVIMRVPIRSSQANIIQSLQDIHKKAMNNQNHHKNNRDYWTTRLILNNEVAQLTEAMERLLGPARVLLLSNPKGEAEKNALEKRVKSLKALATKNNIDKINTSLLRLMALSGIYLSTEEHLKFTADLLDCPENSREVVTIVQSLRKTPFSDNLSYSRSPMVLIPDNNAFNMPWESMPILRNHPVSRLPSVVALNAHLKKYARMLKRDKGFYIVNPNADLVDTQKRFEEFFGQKRLTSWEGVSGSVPSKEQIMAALDDRDLILYMGHGCGDSVFNLHLQVSPATSANMFLIGCSSVRLQHGMMMDGTAFFYKCLMMGSPCVLGNLWMVTSGCIDMMMSSLLTDLLETRKKPRKGQDEEDDKWFQDLVAISRERTRSNFLVGAAPVVIGLPMVY